MAPVSFESNLVLKSLPVSALAELRGALGFVELPVRMPLEQPGAPVEHVYFPTTGIASIVATEKGGLNIEAALVGYEGMTGLPLVLGDGRGTAEVIMQVTGAGWRIEAAALGRLMEDRDCRSLLLRYVQTVMTQMQGTALSYGRGKVETRLGRWLLMCHDRVPDGDLTLTHDFMALMLGVRRAGVTVALHELEGRGLIRATRGRVLIRDREGLEVFTGGFYGGPERHYRRLLPQDQAV